MPGEGAQRGWPPPGVVVVVGGMWVRVVREKGLGGWGHGMGGALR